MWPKGTELKPKRACTAWHASHLQEKSLLKLHNTYHDGDLGERSPPSTHDVLTITVAIQAANVCSASNRDPAPDQALKNCLDESLSNIS